MPAWLNAVPDKNELRRQRHHRLVAGCDPRGTEEGVEVLGAIQGDQRQPVRAAQQPQAAALLQIADDGGEHGVEAVYWCTVQHCAGPFDSRATI